MPRMWKWILALAVGGVGAAFAGLVLFIAPIGTAFVAKTVCSGVFVAGRAADEVHQLDVIADNNPLLPFVSYVVDRAKAEVMAQFLGLQTRVAQFRPGVGCAVAFDRTLARTSPSDRPVFQPLEISLPATNGIDGQALNAIVRSAFDEPSLDRLRRTHAVLVLHRGKLIAEHYAAGFGPATPHVGWSMTKTVTALLIGKRVAEGRLRLEQTDLWPTWRGDGRSAISLANLLQMNSGLAFDENYENPRSDVVRMLHEDGDFAGYALRLPLASKPGTEFHYSSGTTEILSRVLRDSFEGDDEAYWAYPRRALFDPMGIGSATFELDASGTFVGASSMYAGAHDWARIGLMLLDRGHWEKRALLPESWIEFMTTPAASAPKGEYGAHLWTSVPSPYFRASGQRPALPAGTFHMVGHEAQFVSILPSHDLVVVRLGLSRRPFSWDQEAFLDALLKVIPPA